ncbi:hypothetical protein L1887_18732 [Cichorium endivia]|nr:hypothetical protein L1887_18732 [Cichorium endivia]
MISMEALQILTQLRQAMQAYKGSSLDVIQGDAAFLGRAEFKVSCGFCMEMRQSKQGHEMKCSKRDN